MTYGWAKTYTLQLIDQYSVAGTEVPASYNNQADYLKKLPRLLDDAQLLAASTRHKLRATVPVESLARESRDGWDRYALPEDCWRLCGGGLLRPDGGYLPCRTMEDRVLALPAGAGATGLTAEYFRWPRLLGENPAEDDRLDNIPAVQAALPFYAAAHLVMLDNTFAYASLMNEFESRMAAAVPCEAELRLVEDGYGEV